MVQLEEVEDTELDQAQPGPISDSVYDSADFTDTDSELSDDDIITAPPSESLSDRILALRDILPPRYRRALSSSLTTTTSFAKSGAWLGGKGLWILTTGALMMAVPFAMCALEEQQFLEQEREEKARMGAGEVLTGKGEGAGKGL